MTLSDMTAYSQIIGCLMRQPQLLLEYPDIDTSDFDYKPARICFNAIKKLYIAGVKELSSLEVDQEIERCGGVSAHVYANDGGLDFLKHAYESATLGNFKTYYTRLKKCSLLRQLQLAKYDISEFYIDSKSIIDPLQEVQVQENFDNASLEDILNTIEKKYSEIRNKFLNGGNLHGDPSNNIEEVIENLKAKPSIGPALEGKIFSGACRGARKGCFYLKSASTSAGKTRTSVFDACRIAYPKRWSHVEKEFIEEIDSEGKPRKPKKVLFIVTEMDIEEVQTIMLAYLSGVNEEHIITGKYDEDSFGEQTRVNNAAKIMKEYSGYFLIEEISDPNLQNVEATIKKYATVDGVKYVFFDYIHSTASMIGQFSRNNIREDVILMLMANQLKQLAKDYDLFIFSATQVNAAGMAGADDEMIFRDEKSIRGSKAVADKADVGYVMTRVTDKVWGSLSSILQRAVRDGDLKPEQLDKKPTHVLDIYKMRRGRYKMVRIWTSLDLGTGEREDLFITTAENQPFKDSVELFSSYTERIIKYDSDTRSS